MMAELVHCEACGSPCPLGVSKCTTCGSPLGQSSPRNNPAYSKVFSNTKMAVFDIDDTILDVSERFRSARRAGIVNDQGGPVRKGMNSGWQKRNDFLYREDMLDKDRVIAGSKDLISYLMKEGYSIAYCTARDAKNREKTKVQLENKGFPLFKDDRGEVLLFLKEGARRRMKGPAYKADVVSMLQGKYDVRLFFDDNKDNLIAVASLGVPGIYEKVSDYWKMVSARKNPHDITTLKQFVPIDKEAGQKYKAAGGAVVTGTANIDTAYQRMPDPDADEEWSEEEQRFVRPIIAETSAPPVQEDRGSIQKRINPNHSIKEVEKLVPTVVKYFNESSKVLAGANLAWENAKEVDLLKKYRTPENKKAIKLVQLHNKLHDAINKLLESHSYESVKAAFNESLSSVKLEKWFAGGKPKLLGTTDASLSFRIMTYYDSDGEWNSVEGLTDMENAVKQTVHFSIIKQNPKVRNNPNHSKVKKGEKLYEHMNGKAPSKKTTEMIDIGDVWYQVGEGGCWQIGYMSGKETGKSSQKYVHTFNEETQDGNFPKLYATIPESGKPMLIIKGGTWKIKTDKEGVAWIYD